MSVRRFISAVLVACFALLGGGVVTACNDTSAPAVQQDDDGGDDGGGDNDGDDGGDDGEDD